MGSLSLSLYVNAWRQRQIIFVFIDKEDKDDFHLCLFINKERWERFISLRRQRGIIFIDKDENDLSSSSCVDRKKESVKVLGGKTKSLETKNKTLERGEGVTFQIWKSLGCDEIANFQNLKKKRIKLFFNIICKMIILLLQLTKNFNKS